MRLFHSALLLSLFLGSTPAFAQSAPTDGSPPPPLPPPTDITTAPAPEITAAPPSPANPPPAAPSPQLAPPPAVLEMPSWMPTWLRNVTLGGGALLWYYQPFLDGSKNSVSLYFANLVVDAKFGRFALHLEPRFRDTRLRPFFDGPVWLQEAYASVTLGSTVIKAGKIYSHLGYFWDGSFYGNVQVYDGLKLDPDYGLSAEGVLREQRRVGLRWWAQYFVIDGGTNVSLQGRDTISIPGAHRHNQLIGRLEPFFKLSPRSELWLGASGEYLQADLPNVGTRDVGRFAADFKLAIGPWDLWGEYLRQDGQTVTGFPIPPPVQTAAATAPIVGAGQSSSHNNYYWIGTELSLWKLTARYAFSLGDYSDVHVQEWMHLPSLGLQVSSYISLLAEFVWWQRSAPTGTTFVDKSLDITLYAHF
jgi:hypothetical protein